MMDEHALQARLDAIDASLSTVAELEGRLIALTKSVERLAETVTERLKQVKTDLTVVKSRPSSSPISPAILEGIADATGDAINNAVAGVRSETQREILSLKSSAGAAANAAANAANASILAASKTLTGFARSFAYGR